MVDKKALVATATVFGVVSGLIAASYFTHPLAGPFIALGFVFCFLFFLLYEGFKYGNPDAD
jgi:ABC-type Mn2+/Zn2+ transport system permease subunit